MEWLSDLKFLPSKFYLGDTTIVNGNEMKMLSLKEMIENKFIGLNFLWNWKIAQEFMVFFSHSHLLIFNPFVKQLFFWVMSQSMGM